MRPHACVVALAAAAVALVICRRSRRATYEQDASPRFKTPQQTRKEFTVPKAASTRETEVRAVTALSRDGNVSLPEVFVGNDGSSRQLSTMGWSCRWAGRAHRPDGERAVSSRELY